MGKVRIETVENPRGGKGYTVSEHILAAGEKRGNVTMYSRVTLAPHSSIGFHMHEGTGETYFILEGEAVYNDNGEKRMIGPGESTYTPSGTGHGMENDSDKPVVFMALITEE